MHPPLTREKITPAERLVSTVIPNEEETELRSPDNCSEDIGNKGNKKTMNSIQKSDFISGVTMVQQYSSQARAAKST